MYRTEGASIDIIKIILKIKIFIYLGITYYWYFDNQDNYLNAPCICVTHCSSCLSCQGKEVVMYQQQLELLMIQRL